jgi:hypothetical protein
MPMGLRYQRGGKVVSADGRRSGFSQLIKLDFLNVLLVTGSIHNTTSIP